MGSAFTRTLRMVDKYGKTFGGFVHKCGFGLPPSFGKEKSYIQSLSARDEVPNSQMTALGALALANSKVGSSSIIPFTKMMSAVSNVATALGGGSKVCELVPSGTMPCTIGPMSPAISPTRFVMGATVETTRTGRPLTAVPAMQSAPASCSFASETAGSLMFPWLRSSFGCSTELFDEQPTRERHETTRAAVRKFLRICSGYL